MFGEPTTTKKTTATEATETTTTETTTEKVMDLNENFINKGQEVREKIIKTDERTFGGISFFVGLLFVFFFIFFTGTIGETIYTIPMVGTVSQLGLLAFSVVLFIVTWVSYSVLGLILSKMGK